jgi:hypothetical protein
MDEAVAALAVVRSKHHERQLAHFILGAVREELMGGDEALRWPGNPGVEAIGARRPRGIKSRWLWLTETSFGTTTQSFRSN